MSDDVAERRFRVAAADGVGLAVVEVGPSDAPAVVVGHGVGSSARFVLAAFTEVVLPTGRRLVAYDQRGHGASTPVRDPVRHHLDDYASDLAAVTEAVGPVDLVVGISLGGHAAVRAAARQRSNSPVVACLPAWTGTAIAGEGPHAAVAAEVRAVGIGGMVERLRTDTGMRPWLRTTLLTDYPRHDPASLAAALLALDGGDAPSLDEVAALPVPLGLVAWPDDPGHPLTVAQRWAAAAGGHLVTIDLADLDAGLDRLGRAAIEAAREVRGSTA